MNTKYWLAVAMALLAAGQGGGAMSEDLSRLAAANNAFSFQLIKQLAAEKPGKNLFVSPYSAATALAMVGSGAAGTTRTEMQQMLGLTGLSQDSVNAANRQAADLLNSKSSGVMLETANGLWCQQGKTMKPAFTDGNRKYFGAMVKALDFKNAPAAEAEINQWVSAKTHDRIKDLATGLIRPDTDLALANAIYFKGKWLEAFDAKQTKDRAFHPAHGPEKMLPLMYRFSSFKYREGTGYQAVRLPYQGTNLAMYVFLPAKGSSPEKLLQIMNGDNWQRVTMPGFSRREGLVELPRFKLETDMFMNSTLQALGMKAAFGDTADFSGIFADPHKISIVRQKAFVEVAEEGTEAAAATLVGVAVNAAPPSQSPRPKPFEMIVDRPFLFAIVDARSEMILFLGVVNDL